MNNDMNNHNKKLDLLVDEIGNMDEDMLHSALNYKKAKTTLPFKKILSVAAVLAVAVGIGVCVKFAKQNPSGIMSENVIDSESSCVISESDNLYDESENSENPQNSEYADSEFSENLTSVEIISKGEESREESEDFVGSEVEDSKDDFQSEADSSEESGIVSPENPYGNIPSLDSYVKIDDLNKLAYYSGWTMLRKYGIYSKNPLSEEGLKPLSNFGYESFPKAVPAEFVEGIIAGGINNITVSNVEYFQVDINEKCFITRQVLAGRIEVMILNASFDNVTTETMIVFKNKNRYYSCLLDTYSKSPNGDRIYRFKPTRVVCDFNIVSEPEYSDYSFTVTFVNTNDIPQIKFSYKERLVEGEYTLDVSEHTYNSAKNVTVTNSVASLNEVMYKIYVDEVASGDASAIIPENPEMPDNSEEPTLPPVGGNQGIEVIPETMLYERRAKFKEIFGTDSGYAVVNKGTEGYELLKKAYSDENIFDYMDYFPEGTSFIVAWTKGVATFSNEKFYIDDKTVTGSIEYAVLSDSPRYMFKLYCFMQEVNAFEDITVKKVQYSVASTMSFTTENEYDSLEMFGIENEDEFQMHFLTNGRYEIYKNGDKVFESFYTMSDQSICLGTLEEEVYVSFFEDNTFVRELEGWKRVFSLM